MKRLALAAFVLAAASSPAVAQMGSPPASALGEPLELPDLKVGTVTVRVVAGDPARPVDGHDVKLVVDGVTKIARTDPQGRATFAGLSVGAKVKATIETDEGEQSSREFQVPDQTGVAVMLSTAPWQQGRPDPLKMARVPRGEQDDPPGRLTVVVRYNDHDARDPYGDVPVTLVAYAADGQVQAKTVPTDAGGRAVFEDLHTNGNVAYYALTSLPRGDGHDRLQTNPIVPIPEIGMRVMLSGEKLGSPAPPIDDIEALTRVPQRKLPPGQIRVIFGPAEPSGAKVELLDIASGEVIATDQVEHARPLPGSVSGTVAAPVVDQTLPAGEIKAKVVFDVQTGIGLPNTKVRVRVAPPPTPAGPTPAPTAPATGPTPAAFDKTTITDDDGVATLVGAPVGVPLEMVIDVQGTPLTSKPFTLGDKGVTIETKTTFEFVSTYEAIFEGVKAGPSAYLAQLEYEGRQIRSLPFQMVPDRGLVVPIQVGVPQIQVSFDLTGFVDDDYLAVQGDFILINSEWAPWVGPVGGLRLPAPAGAKGLGVADEHKPFVAVDGDAFRLLRPVPPMVQGFRAGWSMQSDDGSIHWDWALPMGAVRAGLDIRMHGNSMRVEPAPGGAGRTVMDRGIKWYSMRPLNIPADRRMIFDVHGMPVRPTWQWIAKLGVGVAVLLVLGAGIFFAVSGTRAPHGRKPGPSIEQQKQRKRRIEELLDEVAAMDRAAGEADAARRARLVRELEGLYKEDRPA